MSAAYHLRVPTIRRVVYTALIGGYEELREQPIAHESALDFICFTDDPALSSDTWQMVLIDPILPEDPIRSARQLKIIGHPRLSGYDETLWIDARVVLRADPDHVLDTWLADADLAVPRHSYRDSVVSEFAEIVRVGFDDVHRVGEQLNHYAAASAERLTRPVPWTGMLARRTSAEMDAVMHEWMRHVWRYSRRDQLSIVEATARSGIEPLLVDIDNHQSDVHIWHGPRGRRSRAVSLQAAMPFLAPIAEVGVLRGEAQRAEEQLAAARLEHRREIDAERARTSAQARLVERLEEDLRLLAEASAVDDGASDPWRALGRRVKDRIPRPRRELP